MMIGQMFQLAATRARFEVIEVSADDTRAIVAGVRTGVRRLVLADERGYWSRAVTDNGRSGPSLFDSLTPAGPRYRMTDMAGR